MPACENGGTIVVGVDGSACSLRALRWAAAQAACTGGAVEAVMAWHLPEIYGYTPRDYRAETQEALDTAIAQALGAQPDVPLTATVVEARPAEALIDASRSAAMLVVGSHGHGAFTGMLLGSVSQHCVTHAHCPVVVFREQRD